MDISHDFIPAVAEAEQGQIKLFSLVLRKGLHLSLHRCCCTGSCLVGSVGGSVVVWTTQELHTEIWGCSWRDHRALSCRLHNKMCFLAAGRGICPQRAVPGLFILVSETGLSPVAGQGHFLSCRRKVMCSAALLTVFWPGNKFWHFPSCAGSARFEWDQGASMGRPECRDKELIKELGLGQQTRGRWCSKMGMFFWRWHSAPLEKCQGSLQQTLLCLLSKPAGSYLI